MGRSLTLNFVSKFRVSRGELVVCLHLIQREGNGEKIMTPRRGFPDPFSPLFEARVH